MSYGLRRVVIGLTLVCVAGVGAAPSFSEEGTDRRVPAASSYARFEDVTLQGPDENFFSPLVLPDPGKDFDSVDAGEARVLRYTFEPGHTDYYVVVNQAEKTVSAPFGEHVVNHRMEVLLGYTVEGVKDGVATIRQQALDFYVTAKRPLRSPGEPSREILIRKRWHGDVIKVWSEEELLADNQGTTNDPQGAGVVAHLTEEIERMTRDMVFQVETDGSTSSVTGPVEFVALFENDFGSPFGLVLPKESVKPGSSFDREVSVPLTEITVSGQCRDELTTLPVTRTSRSVYLGDTKLGKYDCAVFRVTEKEEFENLKSRHETQFGEFPVAIESVQIERMRIVYFAWKEGKVIAYDATHRTKSAFDFQTPMGDKHFETDAKVRWTLVLHDGLTFEKQDEKE